MTVPLLDLKAQYAAIRSEIDEAIARVVASQRFVLGPEVEALEAELAEFCGVRRAVACASGTDALLLALMALDVEPGDEVICPTFTFFATAGSVARLGAVPVFADLAPVTYNVSPETIRAAAAGRHRLEAIIPVDLFGRACDVAAILEIGRDLDAPVVEDAAQAIGTHDAQGRHAGSTARIGCFSFYPTKNLGGYGDGGLVTTDDLELAERLAALRVHGGGAEYYHDEVGVNSRLDAIQAAVLRVKLGHLPAWNEARRAHAALYDRLFADAGAMTTATPLAGGGLPLRTPEPVHAPARHAYHHYVIRVPEQHRDGLRKHLAEQGVGTAVYYPLPLHLQPCFSSLGYARGDLPGAEAAAMETMALPVHPDLTDEQISYAASKVVAYLERATAPSAASTR